jgi:heat shock protein HslJ
MSGKFQTKGRTFSFGKNIRLTKMMCEGYNEDEFIKNMLRVTAYQIKNGVLTMLIDNVPVAKWVRKGAGGMVKL